MGFNWGGKKWRPANVPKGQPKINQSIEELLKPLSEKKWKGNVWGSQIMNVEKETTPDVTPSVTPTPSSSSIPPSVTPTPTVTPSITPTPSSSVSLLAFQQTDSTFSNGESNACSPYGPVYTYNQRTATIGGSAGTADVTCQIDNSSVQWGLQSKLTIPSDTNWNAGTWTVRLRTSSTVPSELKLHSIYICRVNSSNVSQATIGSVSVNTTIATNTTYTATISGSSQTPSLGDYVNIVFVFENTKTGVGTQTFTIKSNQVINSPFSTAPSPSPSPTPTATPTVTPTPSPVVLTLNQSYQGGIIVYILQSGDTGYDANVQHGLIMPTTDTGGVNTLWGCFGTNITGTTSSIGSGQANTTAIVNQCATAGIAARLCDDLTSGGYSDWYLPSKDEWVQINGAYSQSLIPAANLNGNAYWTSTQYDANTAWLQKLNDEMVNETKNSTGQSPRARAVRSF